MKISVIIAVIHMTLGVFVKASNSLFYRKYLDFFFEFLPQLIFLIALFGYMDFLIIFKWLQFWPDSGENAPSIITTMINLPLKFGKTVPLYLYRKIAVEVSRCGEHLEIHLKISFKWRYFFWQH